MRPFIVTAVGGEDQGNGAGVSKLALVNYMGAAPLDVTIQLVADDAATVDITQTVDDLMGYLQSTADLPAAVPATDSDTLTPLTGISVGTTPTVYRLRGSMTGLLAKVTEAGVTVSMTVLQSGR